MILDERGRWFAFFFLDWLRGGKVRKYYDEIRAGYRKGTSVSETEEKIRKLIAHAVTTTAHYRGMPEDTPLSRMPVVNKDTFRAGYDGFLSDPYRDRKDSRSMSTSGSTGTPLTIIQDRDKIDRDTADGIFFGAMAGYYIGMKMGFLRVWVHNVKKSRLRLFAENTIMVDTSVLGDQEIRKMLDMFRKKKVKCLLGYASALGEISRYMERNGIDGRSFFVRAIIPISEGMPDGIREMLERQFGCPVSPWYSNEENGIMGIYLKESGSYYIDSENFYYEILKLDSDEAAEEGELGRIVITDLRNYAFPMIRYDTGDLASFRRVERKGRFRLFLTALCGRRSDTIYDTRGNALTPFVITNNLWDVKGLMQYRFIQETETDYTLELNGDPKVVDAADILARIKPYFGENANIRTLFVEEIPVLNSGKRKYIENRCPSYMK
ncbi:MAG: phenylacetate--CoA ligase family protein [Lachnospiraceae bacterium]|nr:phenylacetate--CoA ligase family protein [Lachnospiraceae bacterium]